MSIQWMILWIRIVFSERTNIMFRQSVFYGTQEEADQVFEYVKEVLDGLDELEVQEIGILQDGDSNNYELRFITQRPLDRYEQSMLLTYAPPQTYTLNVED